MRPRCFHIGLSAFLVLQALSVTLGTRIESASQIKDAEIGGDLFPLKTSLNGRSLIDQQDHPFLVVGDTAWSLIADLSMDDIKYYLDDRQKRGFNSIIVNLIEHKFSTNAPKAKSGESPFLSPGDFSKPNHEYFTFAESVVAEANRRGVVVWLFPAYVGYNGGDEGWFQEIKACDRKTLRDYGRYVGKRFQKHSNLIWVMGGDFAPPEADKWTVDELAAGLRDAGSEQLMCAHGSRGPSAAIAFPGRAWLGINMVYSDDKRLHTALLSEFNRRPIQPFVLLENFYENENNATPELIRRQAYWTMLGGGCGQFFGNNPIWHFDGPGLFKVSMTWREALSSQGSQDMTRLKKVFAGHPWFTLRPDIDQRIVVERQGNEALPVVTAVSSDGKLAMSYLASTGTESREVTVNLADFSGPVTAQWYNPTTGDYQPCEEKSFPNRGDKIIRTPGDNGSKANDWLLILETLP